MHATNNSTGGKFAASHFGTYKFGAYKFARGKCAATEFRDGEIRAKLAEIVGEMGMATKWRAAELRAIRTPQGGRGNACKLLIKIRLQNNR